MTTIIRQYHPDDLHDVVSCWHASKRHAFPYVAAHQEHTYSDDVTYFRSAILSESDVWVAELDKEILGFMALNGDFIDQLFVRPDVQRHGIGTALLDMAKTLSPAGLRLFTYQRNEQARRFYERHEFVAVHFGVSPSPENEPDVEYRWTPADEHDAKRKKE